MVTPKLKSVSTPSTPATNVSFELPPENIVLQGRVSSFSMNDGSDHQMLNELESPNTVNTKYSITSPHEKITADKVSDEDNDSEHDETSPLISKRQYKHTQLKTRQHLRSQHIIISIRTLL